MSRIKFITTSLLIIVSSFVQAQTLLKGFVYDAETNLPLRSASVSIPLAGIGTITGTDGGFKLQTTNLQAIIMFSSTGYTSISLPINQVFITDEPAKVFLKPTAIDLKEVKIIASIAHDRQTPISQSNILTREATTLAGDRSFPELMRTVPGVYATRTGGGSGDAAINIRGFKQENIALMVNGIPVGSVENGLVYWSNWDGLSSATQSLQVQKGFGATRIAANSVGGTVNIITQTTDSEKKLELDAYMTDYGNTRQTLNLSTGKLSNGTSVTFIGSHTQGPGYVDATQVDAWSYLLSVSNQIHAKHKLVFTMMGSPERHGQRNFKNTQTETDKYGIKYNKDWGYYAGTKNNLSENFYHKPQISLNHYYTLNAKTQLNTSVYYSFGKGGGKWAENYSGNYVFNYRTSSGQIDWDAVAYDNTTNQGIYITSTGDTLRNFAKNAQTLFLASHWLSGVISSVSHQFSTTSKLTTGLHGRYFKSSLWEEIYDLLGSKYFIDDYAWAIDGRGGRNIQKIKGDKVRINNGSAVGLSSFFTQYEYTTHTLSALLTANVSQNWFKRYDWYNYTQNAGSEVVAKPSAELKAGLNYNFSKTQTFFGNIGFASRAPYYKFVFPNYNNNAATNLKNERILTLELGYGLYTDWIRLKLNTYYSLWQNKSMLSNEYQLIDNNSTTRSMVTGLDALHYGLETELWLKPLPWLELSLFGSFANWTWQNDVEAVLYNNENLAIDTINVYAKNLKIGDAPQTQIGGSAHIKAFNLFDFSATTAYYDQFYADFDPAKRTNAADRAQSFMLPAYSITDIQLGLPFEVFGNKAYGSINCSNLFNTTYILRGEDGNDHTLNTFSGFWGFGRTFTFRIKMSL